MYMNIFSLPEHHLTLLAFLPLMVDSTSRVYYLCKNIQRSLVVGCQVEVTNGFKFVYCVDCVRWCVGWCVSYKIWQLYIPWNKILMWLFIKLDLGHSNYRSFPGEITKREMGVKYGRLPGKTAALTGMYLLSMRFQTPSVVFYCIVWFSNQQLVWANS